MAAMPSQVSPGPAAQAGTVKVAERKARPIDSMKPRMGLLRDAEAWREA
jgi:hypothetical protein